MRLELECLLQLLLFLPQMATDRRRSASQTGLEFRMPLYDAVNTPQIMRSTIRVYDDDDAGARLTTTTTTCWAWTVDYAITERPVFVAYVCFFYARTMMAGEWTMAITLWKSRELTVAANFRSVSPIVVAPEMV
uniref:Putative secreted protein n=1 Tax=Anopheles marajoara TaxID=58244 RepID=A0A2M4C7C4_9DIPT